MKNENTENFIAKIFNRETIVYVIVGVLTTLVDYVVYMLLNESLKMGGMVVERSSTIAQAVSWAVAVLFAYITNKVFVFRNRNFKPSYLVRELVAFLAARIISGVITLVGQGLIVACFSSVPFIEYIAKLIGSAFNLVFNYVASKLVIFKKDEKQ
ncbi:MAG: GtrA family protein [Eubacteriales bacterium]|nr:GtrA family protein [Eubacteriales bacterium]